LRIASKNGVVEVRLARFRLRVRDRAGRLLTAEPNDGGAFFERVGGSAPVHLGRVRDVAKEAGGAVLTVETGEDAPTAVRLRWTSERTLEVTIEPPAPDTLAAFGDRFRSPGSEAIYGLTERLRDSPLALGGALEIPEDDVKPQEVGSLDRRGETVEMLVRPTFSLYAPFYQSSRGYGLAVAGTTFGLFDVAKTDPAIVSFRFEAGTTPEHRRLTYRVFVGPEHRTILDEYTALTGRPIVPPDWAFLHWRWRGELERGPTAMLDGVDVNADAAEDVLMYDALGIQPGVYIFDRPVLIGEPGDTTFGFSRFVWDPVRLPNQDQLLASLRSRGYRVMMWSAAWACGTEPGDNGADARSMGFIAPGPDAPTTCGDLGAGNFILDVTNPAARDWFRDRLAAFLAAYDIDGIKLDRGEEHIASESTDVWADGRTGREVRNAYPTLQAQMHNEALAAAHPDGDFVLFSRPGYTGTAQYAVFWGGDIPGSEDFGFGKSTDLGLRSAIISQQRAAFMGFPIWGSDTGGYYEFKDREVFARWIEFSAFSGIMEIGGVGNHAPWNMPTDPTYDQELIGIYKRYTDERVRLHQYIVDAAREAATGMPIVRPLVFLDRKDRKLRDRWDEYLFGPDLLVAPVWKSGERSREVYFPKGTWHSYWDASERVKGPRTLTVDVPLDTIPVWVRGDATVP
jgi:alpha-glucosidase (family GH31 glycosyl hydrolase)